ncbi:MAG TPA: YbjN domain-containing protein [Acidimicrobiales bacterium]|nr:YbjN domain-containing protein [Acidimicrobiales bacterium]
MDDPPASPEQLESFRSLIDEWAAAEARTNALLAHVEWVPEDRRWLVRMRGEDKAVITVWLTLRERTLHYETYFMPAPEEDVERCWEYLLRLNNRLYAMRFAIGAEDAVYLVGQLPLKAVDAAELDRIIGAAYAYTEQYFRAALAIGFGSRFRA